MCPVSERSYLVTERLYFFGDSICFGQHVSPHETWIACIAARLAERYGPDAYMVNNPSISGDTTRKALERMPQDVQAHAPDYCIVQFGMNDCNFWQSDRGLPRVSPDAFVANLDEILERLRTFGTRRIFLNTNHPSSRVEPSAWAPVGYQAHNERYNHLIRAVAERHRSAVMLIDVEAAWRDRIRAGQSLSDLILADGIHLSRQGHAAYCEIVWDHVSEALDAARQADRQRAS